MFDQLPESEWPYIKASSRMGHDTERRLPDVKQTKEPN